MFCDKCGSTLNANGTCPICDSEATTVLDESVVVDSVPVEPVEPAKDPGKTQGIVSLVMGIVGLVVGSGCSCAFALCGGVFSMIFPIVGIVLGAMGMKKSKEAGFKGTLAMVGLILSIVAAVVVLICMIVGMIIGGAMGAEMANSSYYYY